MMVIRISCCGGVLLLTLWVDTHQVRTFTTDAQLRTAFQTLVGQYPDVAIELELFILEEPLTLRQKTAVNTA